MRILVTGACGFVGKYGVCPPMAFLLTDQITDEKF